MPQTCPFPFGSKVAGAEVSPFPCKRAHLVGRILYRALHLQPLSQDVEGSPARGTEDSGQPTSDQRHEWVEVAPWQLQPLAVALLFSVL